MRALLFSVIFLGFIAGSGMGATLNVPSTYSTIQSAIDVAVNGDTVLIASGGYVENISYSGKNIVVTSNGEVGTTILSPANASLPIVLFSGGEDRSAVLDGFTLMGSSSAAAIWITNSSPTVKSCRFRDHTGVGQDQAIIRTTNSAAPLISNNTFYSSPTCWGAFYADGIGGGAVEFINNTIDSGYRGLICYAPGSKLLNNIIINCSYLGMYDGGNVMTRTYNDVWNNNPNYGGAPGFGDISLNPLFADPAVGNYSLQSTSPCIDVGDPDPSFMDPDGTRNDMGAIYYDQGTAVIPVLVYGLSVVGEHQTHVVSHTPTITWHYFHPTNPQQSFEAQVGTDNDWSVAEVWTSGAIGSMDTFVVYAGSPLIDGITYYYRIRGSDGVTWSNWWSNEPFRMNTAPSQPAILLPDDGITMAYTGCELLANAISDLEADTILVSFEVYTDAGLINLLFKKDTVIPSGGSARTGLIGGVIAGDTYWWRVQSSDGWEMSSWSPVRAFFARMNGITIHVPSEFSTISSAVNVCGAGDTVLVSPGTYSENVSFSGKNAFVTSNGEVGTTILSPANASLPIVLFSGGEDRSAVLDGFTLVGSTSAAAIWITNSSPTVKSCRFRDHNGSGQDQAIIRTTNSATPLISNNIFYSSPTCWGAFYADGIGGGAVEFINNTIDSGYRGLICYAPGSKLLNNIIINCSYLGMYDGGNVMTRTYNDVWNNNPNYGGSSGFGDISLDPLFADPTAGDYSLQSTSPCIDAGNPDPLYMDPDGTRNDIGASYYDQSAPVVINVTFGGEAPLRIVGSFPVFSWKFVSAHGISQTAFEIAVGTDNDWAFAEKWNPAPFNSADTFVTYAGGALVDGATYYLRLRVSNGTEWSQWYNTSFRMNSVPATPSPLSPDSGVSASTTPTLWVLNATDAENDALTYEFQGFHDTDCVAPPIALTGVAQTPDSTGGVVTTPLGENCHYWWQVRAFDGFEYSPWSVNSMFAVNGTPEPPTAPDLASPPEPSGKPVFDLKPTFIWSASSDPDPNDTVRYRLEISTTQNFTFVNTIDSLLAPTHEVADSLFFGTRYWWKVSAFDKTGLRTYSPTVSDFWTWKLGDVNHTHSVNIVDLTAMVAFLFTGGTAPDPKKVADINGNCSVNIVDVTYFVNYLFGGGADPQIGCAP